MDGLRKSILLWRDWRSTPVKQYKTMTVRFNITETPGYGTYLDDATGMPYGKTTDAVTAWQEFFGYKPCLFKDGQVVGYLNPDNYAQFEDGTSADITSGGAGDVMVEFPRRGIKINKTGTTVTVSMTDDPNASGFSYKAHNRKNAEKDYFYIGAYHAGITTSNRVTSLSNVPKFVGSSMSSVRTYCNNKGVGYMNVGFYQYLFIQCMYLLEYKGHLNSQQVHGYGFVRKSGDYSYERNGKTDRYGMMHGTDNTGTTTAVDRIKLFGIEDFWGNYSWMVDGCIVDSNYNVLIGYDEFNDYGSGYTNYGTICGTSSITNFMNTVSDAQCTSDTGFLPSSVVGPVTTNNLYNVYFCDSTYFKPNTILTVGGNCVSTVYAGIFLVTFKYSPKSSPTSSDYVTCRLAYL